MQRTYEKVRVIVRTEDENDNPITKAVMIEYSSVDKAKDINRKTAKALGTNFFKIKSMVRVSELRVMNDEDFYKNSELKEVSESEYKPIE